MRMTGAQVAKLLLGFAAFVVLAGGMLVMVLLMEGCGAVTKELVQCQLRCQEGVCRLNEGGGYYECVVPPVPSPSPIPPSPEPTPTPEPTAPPTVPPTPEPTPSPSVEPSPLPTPTPSPSTTPEPPVPEISRLKLGFRGFVPKWDGKDGRGARNTLSVTPLDKNGNVIGPEYARGIGCALIAVYGEFQRFQVVEGRRSDLEKQGAELDDCGHEYILVDATNSDDNPEHWSGKTYLMTGRRTYCVSWPQLRQWRCQDGEMDSRGVVTGIGNDRGGYDLAKAPGEK